MKKFLKSTTAYTDMRDAFFEELFQIALHDHDVILLHADQGAQTFQKFYSSLPKQIFNAGVAEQNMISVAGGLALSGKKVFVHAISTFITLRCYEQIKVDLSVMNLPVTIAGVGPGFTYGADGPTHHSNQDIAIMRAIPHMRILNATDFFNLAVFPHLTYSKPQLTYIRFEKGNFPDLYSSRIDSIPDGLAMLKPGKKFCFITTGTITHKAIDIAKNLKEKSDLDIAVIDIYQLKPLNEKILKKLIEPFEVVFTLEEHLSYGGLGTIVSDFLADHSIKTDFLRIGLPDGHCFIYGDRDYMHKQIGIASDQVIRKIDKFLRSR
ncbi:MAG: 1-deoxy-D-xylulose-5-phosphate synthase [Candidatus Levybacteria bacterium]|nr:1-deoxy-D-xylulose-5-phosphate synthase [Candidatus Levybacteria bacterium]